MKHNWVLGLVLMWGAACAFAQPEGTAAAAASNSAASQISDTEAVGLAQTINGYVQGATHRGYLELFDRKKEQPVTLRLDRIISDDPARITFPETDKVTICGECTEVQTVKGADGVTKEEPTGDKYEACFVVLRGDTVSSRVLDTFIKSVNGKPMYTWTQDASGKWSATVVPDAP